MADINVSMNVDSIVNAAKAMTVAIAGTTATLKEAELVSARYGRTGTLLEATLRGIDSAGRNVTVGLSGVTGTLQLASAKIDEVSKRAEAAKLKLEALAKVKLDTLEKKAEGAKLKFEALEKKAEAAANKISGIGKAIGDMSSMFQRFAGFKVLNTMNDALKSSFNNARNFQVQVSLIRTISQDAQLSFGGWSKGLKQTSDQLGFSLEDTTKAAYDAISNQVVRGSEVFGFLKDAGDLARLSFGGTLEQGVNLLSSAINAYGLTASSAKELSALFFATIDEGRVTMKDMADTFGRVAILAKGLNVPISELSASIAFLTQKGVTTDDAFTFMRNVFVQMEKPSTQLSAFFRSIGVESGKAAVATFGFMGTLQKIRNEVEGGNLEVAKLFPEIRAQQPIQAALNDFEGFKRIADKFKDTAELIGTYQKAIDIRAESPADYINKEFNKIKNTITADVGQQLLDLVQKILVAFSSVSDFLTGNASLSAGLNVILVLFRDVTIAILAFRTAAALTGAGMAAYAAYTKVATVATAELAITTAAANKAMRASLVGLVAAGVAVLAAKFAFSNDIVQGGGAFESITAEIKTLREEAIKLKAVREGLGNGWTGSIRQRVDTDPGISKRIVEGFQTALQGIAKFSIEADGALTKARQNAQNSTKDFENAFQSYSDNLKKISDEISKRITESENQIKNSRKGLTDFKDSLNDAVNSIRGDNAVGSAKFDFLDKLQALNKNKAVKLYQTGTPEDIQEADKFFSKIRDLEIEKFKHAQEYFKQQRKLYEDQNPREVKLNDIDYKNKALNDSIGLEKKLNDLLDFRKKLVDDLVTKKKEEISLDEKKLAQDKLNVRNVEDKFKNYNEFSAFESDGTLAAKYKDKKTGRLDPNAVKVDFDRVSNELRGAVSASGDVAGRVQVETTIAERRKQLLAELTAAERVEIVKATQFRLSQNQKEFEDKLAANKRAFEDTVNKQKAVIDAADKIGPDISAEFGKLPSYKKGASVGGQEVRSLTTDIRGIKLAAANKEAAAGQKAVIDYQRAVTKLREDQTVVNGQQVPKGENVEAFMAASQNLIDNIKMAFGGLLGKDFQQFGIPSTNNTQTFGDLIEVLKRREDTIAGSQNTLNVQEFEGKFLLGQNEKQINPMLEQLKSIRPDIFSDLTAANLKASLAVNSTSDSMLQLRQSIELLRDSFANFKPPQFEGGSAKSFSGELPTTNSEPVKRALGGWVGRPSSTIGADKYPMMAGDGEFVVNAESASMFASTLTQINKARRGSNVNKVLGGNVSSTNVGDITIIVNESKAGNDTGRQVWSQIRRQMRLGNINTRE